jgi:hypothetical protein
VLWQRDRGVFHQARVISGFRSSIHLSTGHNNTDRIYRLNISIRRVEFQRVVAANQPSDRIISSGNPEQRTDDEFQRIESLLPAFNNPAEYDCGSANQGNASRNQTKAIVNQRRGSDRERNRSDRQLNGCDNPSIGTRRRPGDSLRLLKQNRPGRARCDSQMIDSNPDSFASPT